MTSRPTSLDTKAIGDLCRAFLSLETEEELFTFLKDLCTPSELSALSERWQICVALHHGLSYRDIHSEIGASLTTIGRVARFLRDEPYHGYRRALAKYQPLTETLS